MSRPRPFAAARGFYYANNYTKQEGNPTPTRIDTVLLTVSIGGVDVSDVCLEASVKLGYELRTAEADVTLTSLPAGANYWDSLVIACGLGSTGMDTAGLVTRFNGYVFDLNWDSWPDSVKVIGRGPLILADREMAPRNEEADYLALPDPTSVASKYEPPGIDLSCNPDTLADWTDSDMVTYVLDKCGLTSRIDPVNGIGGLGILMGTVATDQFYWKYDQSGLSFIEELDKVCLGFRTFEILGGYITRANTSPRSPFDHRVFEDLQEGREVGFDDAPATMNRSAQAARNRAVVQGYDDGGGPVVAVVIGATDLLPPGIAYDTESLSSPMIEGQDAGDDGLTCQAVGEWLLDERRYPMMEAVVPTWRDDPFSPGQVLYLNAPSLDVNQSMWLKSVEIRVTGDSFTQTATLRDRAQRDLSGNLVLPGITQAAVTMPRPLGRSL